MYCSADAVIPVWAYMLVTSYLQPYAKEVIMGDEAAVLSQVITNRIHAINPEDYRDKRIVVKGCGEKPMGDFAYLEITKMLQAGSQIDYVWRALQYSSGFKAESTKPKA